MSVKNGGTGDRWELDTLFIFQCARHGRAHFIFFNLEHIFVVQMHLKNEVLLKTRIFCV